jgi:hypothetical protein
VELAIARAQKTRKSKAAVIQEYHGKFARAFSAIYKRTEEKMHDSLHSTFKHYMSVIEMRIGIYSDRKEYEKLDALLVVLEAYQPICTPKERVQFERRFSALEKSIKYETVGDRRVFIPRNNGRYRVICDELIPIYFSALEAFHIGDQMGLANIERQYHSVFTEEGKNNE